jgi:hypothetical protein
MTIAIANSWPIPDSGQTKCYDNESEIPCPKPGELFYGQDGNYNINPPSYTKLDEKGNELHDDATSWVMVRDNVTGLIWEIKTANDGIKDYTNPHDADNKYTWYDTNPENNLGDTGTAGDGTDTEDFIKALNDEAFGGHTDWRMPDIYELASITDLSSYGPAIQEQLFPNIMSAFCWSSTSHANYTGSAWGVYFNYGYDDQYAKAASSYYVRAVRGGQCRSFGHLVINDGHTVTDFSTGLMWDLQTQSNKSWFEALSVCENSELGSFSDWRLPNREELRSIVSYQHVNPAINYEIFQDIMSAFYWSSTSYARSTGDAWGVYFNYGDDDYNAKDSSYYVRAVRGGQCRFFGHLFIWSPNQASGWEAGDIMPIRWDTQNIPGNTKITLSRQGGKPDTFELIAETPNDGEFDWLIQGKGSVNCMLKIEPLEDMDKWTQQSLFMITDFAPQNPTSSTHEINVQSTDNTITIEWTAPEIWGREIAGYAIQWDHLPNTLPGKTITTQSLHDISPPLTEGNDHYVHIRVVDDQGHWANVGAHLGPFRIKHPDVPVPKGLQISANNKNQLELTWYYMGDHLTYNVYKSLSANGFFIKCDPNELTEPKFVDTDVTPGLQYFYKVTSRNALGEESLGSTVVSAKIAVQEGGGFQLLCPHAYHMQLSGLKATYHIQIIPEGGYSEEVNLNVSDLPLWMNASFSQNPVKLPGFATLTVNISDNVVPNHYLFHVSAQGENRLKIIDLYLDVNDLSSKESAISAYTTRSQLYLHQSIEIYGNIVPRGINTPVSIYIQHESDDQPIIINTSTDLNKSYQTTYVPEKTGQYVIFSQWNGDTLFNTAESSHLTLTVLRGKSKLTCQTPDEDISDDKMVQITGQLQMPSIGDAHIVLLKKYINDNGDDDLERIENKIFTEADGRYSYSIKLDKEGLWEITACWEGNETYSGSISDPLRLYPGLKAGKALIVAGGGLTNNRLWSTTKYLTTRFYKLLVNRKFPKELIYYISPDINHDDDQVVINDNTPAVSDIQNYIENLYQNLPQPEVNSERPFILYMADHGGDKTFKVNHGLEILEASQLDTWLDMLQTQTGCSVYIILEACFSGTFVDILKPSDNQKRVIVTSTDNHVAVYDSDGRVSFSQFFFNGLNAGYNLNQSFQQTKDLLRNKYLFSKQFPQICDGQDGNLAQKSYIGGNFVVGDILPEIVDHTLTQSLSASSHDLFVVVADVEGINRVWVSILPPNFKMPETNDAFDTPIINLPEIPLTDQGNGRYQGRYEHFYQRGIYHVSFFCEDLAGNVVSKDVLLNVIDGYIAGDLDNNGKVSLCDAILALQSLAGMPVLATPQSRILCNGQAGTCEIIEILQAMVGMK